MSIPYKKNKFSKYSPIPVVLAGFCSLSCPTLYAAEYEYLIEATAHAEHIDNPRRSDVADQDEFLSQQRLRGTLSRATSKVLANVDYQGTKNNYQNNLLADRTFVTGASSLSWIIAPDRFTWDASNTRSLQVVDSLLPDTIDNRQVISLTSTGPRATVQLSGRNKLSGSVNYSIAEYEMSELSSQDRIVTDVQLSHNFSSKYTSSLGGNYLQSEVDGAPMLSFNRYEYFWQNQYVTEIFDVSLMLGQNVLRRDNFEDQENFLVRFTGSYKLNSQSSLNFNYSNSYEDVFSNMLRSPANPSQLIGDRFGDSNFNQNFKMVEKSVNYLYTRSEFFNMNIGYSQTDRTYEALVNARNQASEHYNIGANWKLFQNLDFSLYGRYTEQEFVDFARAQDRKEYGMRASYRLSKSLYTQFNVSSVDQKGTLPMDNYDGLNYSISITFTLGN